MADCLYGSELIPGIPDGLVRVRRLDFTPSSVPRILNPFYSGGGGGGWTVDIAEALAPEQASTYGVLYEGDLLSRFCSGVPPLDFPGYPIGDVPFLRSILNAIWNQNCQCKKPPVGDCCGTYGGRGQGLGETYSFTYRFGYTTPTYGSYVFENELTLTRQGALCESFVVEDQQGTSLFLKVNDGTPQANNYQIFGRPESGTKIVSYGIDAATIRRTNGQSDDFCQPPIQPSYDESGLNGTIRDGSRPSGARNDADVVVITVPALPGQKGDKGDKGDSGQNGVDGGPGLDGQPGNDGAMGVPGTNGTDGSSGSRGADGTPGERGIPGVPGQDGAPGEPGVAQKISIRNVARVALGVASSFNIVSETEAAIVYDLFLEDTLELVSQPLDYFYPEDGVATYQRGYAYFVSDGTNNTKGSAVLNAYLLSELIKIALKSGKVSPDWVELASGVCTELQPVVFTPLLPLKVALVRLVVQDIPDAAARTYRLAGDASEYGLGNANLVVENTGGAKDLLGQRFDVFTRSTVQEVPLHSGRLRLRVSLRIGVTWSCQYKVFED